MIPVPILIQYSDPASELSLANSVGNSRYSLESAQFNAQRRQQALQEQHYQEEQARRAQDEQDRAAQQETENNFRQQSLDETSRYHDATAGFHQDQLGLGYNKIDAAFQREKAGFEARTKRQMTGLEAQQLRDKIRNDAAQGRLDQRQTWQGDQNDLNRTNSREISNAHLKLATDKLLQDHDYRERRLRLAENEMRNVPDPRWIEGAKTLRQRTSQAASLAKHILDTTANVNSPEYLKAQADLHAAQATEDSYLLSRPQPTAVPKYAPQAPAAPAAPDPETQPLPDQQSAITQEDILYTAQKHNMHPEDVINRLSQMGLV